MTVHESEIKLKPSVSAKSHPDTPIAWYDFGGGITVAPGIPGTSNATGHMASLYCVRDGEFYFMVLEGEFSEEDLPSMFKEYATVFSEEVEKKTQETQK